LLGTEADLESPDFEEIHAQLERMRPANAECRFIYLLAHRSGEVIFLVDSEPFDSPDSSPPGQVYEDASPELLRAFATGEAMTEGPLPDDWGVWVSALVPIRDPGSGNVKAILGMDVAAEEWASSIASERITPILMTLLLALLLIAFFVAMQSSRAAAERVMESESRLAPSSTMRRTASSSGSLR
jgi:hypothetical protein